MIDDEDERDDDLPPGSPGAFLPSEEPDTLSDTEEEQRDDLTLSLFGDGAPESTLPASEAPPSTPAAPLAAPALGNSAAAGGAYLVLARKYRPQTFESMIGQEAMVRTLTNAFASGRIAHAYMLTGVRGVGKTTTARLLARALNYARDGADGPSVVLDPPGIHCADIQAGRHPDVFELDAASRTGVSDMREVLDGVRYGPISARYKVYVIDEVHMLSTAAFNALLKTLEEPPPHAKFIFATTEIRKVPVTILSRCQRFDLRRVETARLADYLGRICATEGVKVDADALGLIARAAEGSVRDAQSLLDQAIVQDQGSGVDAAMVRDMLGLADRGRILDLLDALVAGDAKAALRELSAQHARGAQPDVVLRDLMDLTHEVARAQALGAAWRPEGPRDQTGRIAALAERLGAAAASRLWQLLLRGHEECQRAPDPLQAADMCLLRACAAQSLPGPEDLARLLAGGGPVAASDSSAPTPWAGGAGTSGAQGSAGAAMASPAHARAAGAATVAMAAAPDLAAEPMDGPQTFEALLSRLEAAREVVLVTELERFVRPVSYSVGHVVLAPTQRAAPDLVRRTLEAVGRIIGPSSRIRASRRR
jgi:DNA polymerase III subunit gamma/tau